MPKIPIKVDDIKSFSPAIETRNSQDIFVIKGRNFSFDSKGPKSDFGNRLIANGSRIERDNGLVQSIEVAGRSFAASMNGIWELTPNGKQWVKLIDFSNRPRYLEALHQRWTSAYISSGIYLCHPSYGLYRIGRKQIVHLTREEIPGLPIRPVAAAESNGRLVILNTTHVSWSAPADGNRFTPELGGAGQQLLSEKCAGIPQTVMGFPNGFVVWTSSDCLIAEFIGGDLVWRWSRSATKQIPISASVVEEMPNASHCIITKQGLYITANGKEPEILTPIFNEFLRDFIAKNPQLILRSTYNINEDRLFVQARNATSSYVRTFVLSVSLDKWGEFSESHLGIIRWTDRRSASGFVDLKGRAHRFAFTWDREIEPGVFVPLDAEIEIGHFKNDGTQESDALMEFQELFVGITQRPSWSQPEKVDLGFIGEIEESTDDLGMIPSIVTSQEDMNGPYSLLNHTHYNVSVASDLDGMYDEIVTEPALAVEKPAVNLYTLLTSGIYHRVRISATQEMQRFHLQTLTGTVYYQGQLS